MVMLVPPMVAIPLLDVLLLRLHAMTVTRVPRMVAILLLDVLLLP